MNFTDLRVYLLNLSAITASTLDLIEDGLKLLLLFVSIVYTIQKICDQKNSNKKKK